MNIETESEFREAIDRLGDIEAQIEHAAQNAKVLKLMLEIYANANGVRNAKTDRYAFKMSAGTASLRRAKDTSDADVIALLKKSEVMRGFVTESYDAAAIKAYAKGTEGAAEALAQVGLYLTEPKRHAIVTRR